MGLIVRPSRPDDAEALAAIYGHHVLHGVGTFEETPPSASEVAARRQAIVERGLPHLVGDDDGRVLGFAYAAPFRARAAYRYTVEDSVYVAPDAMGRGVGKAVLGAVIERCETMGFRQMMAVIGDSANAASIGVHRTLGFRRLGVGEGLGFKHGRWVDVVWMQRAMNGGADGAPVGPGLDLREG